MMYGWLALVSGWMVFVLGEGLAIAERARALGTSGFSEAPYRWAMQFFGLLGLCLVITGTGLLIRRSMSGFLWIFSTAAVVALQVAVGVALLYVMAYQVHFWAGGSH